MGMGSPKNFLSWEFKIWLKIQRLSPDNFGHWRTQNFRMGGVEVQQAAGAEGEWGGDTLSPLGKGLRI